MKLAIVIPIYNGLAYTKKCLENLDKNIPENKKDKFHVVIVDDGSTDGSGEWIKTHYPGVTVINGTGGLWWSGGMNVGIHHVLEKTSANYILWWNNDILPGKDYFVNLFAILEKNDPKTIIGSKIYMDIGRKIIWSMGGIFQPVTGKKYMIGFKQEDRDIYNHITQADWLPGMGTVIHRSIFEDIGYLDNKNFPQYHGDSEFTYRAKSKGYKLEVHPNLRIWNDTTHTGIKHGGNFKNFKMTLFGIKSNYNIHKDLKFYHMYARGPQAYIPMASKYFKYVGGFFKWKVLGMFNIQKPSQP
ncbi:MAG: glycosyltransferase family 2 protein [Bacteroidota bacterium]